MKSHGLQPSSTGVGCHCLLQCMKVKSESEVSWTAAFQYWSGVPLPSPKLCIPLSYVCVLSHVQLFVTPWVVTHQTPSQARILEWVAILFSRVSSRHRDGAWVFCIGRWILYQ